MLGTILSNVPPGTANALSYTMLIVVAMFLTSGPLITWYYYRKSKRMKASPATPS